MRGCNCGKSRGQHHQPLPLVEAGKNTEQADSAQSCRVCKQLLRLLLPGSRVCFGGSPLTYFVKLLPETWLAILLIIILECDILMWRFRTL